MNPALVACDQLGRDCRGEFKLSSLAYAVEAVTGLVRIPPRWVEATAQLSLKGAVVQVNGSGAVQVTSGGPAAIKGTPLALN